MLPVCRAKVPLLMSWPSAEARSLAGVSVYCMEGFLTSPALEILMSVEFAVIFKGLHAVTRPHAIFRSDGDEA
jgi:hypothetical protein